MRLAAARVGHTVTADLVHRVDPWGVLLDRWRRTRSSVLVFEASLGPDRVFRRGEGGRIDLLSVAEVVRQAGLAAAHLETGLPISSPLAMQHLELELLRPGAIGPDDRVDVMTRVHDVVTDADGRPSDLSVRLRLSVGATDVARASVRWSVPWSSTFATRHAQRATPWRSTLPRLDPSTTGTDRAEDVLLSPGVTASSWQLAVDTSRVRGFDHAVDHVPGLVLLDACRQAWAATGGPEPTRLRASFLSYVTLERPAWVSRVDDGRTAGADEPSLLVTQGHDLAAIVGLFAPEAVGRPGFVRQGFVRQGPVGRLLALSRPSRSDPQV